MSKLRYLLDEHVSHAIQSQLLRLDADNDVLAVGQPGAPEKGTDDRDILVWIEKAGYVFVTGYMFSVHGIAHRVNDESPRRTRELGIR